MVASVSLSAARQQESSVHRVVAGETLSGIAASAGESWQQLYAANQGVVGANPNLIYAGQVLSLNLNWSPAPAAAPAPAAGGAYGQPYTCGDGDGDGWDMPCGGSAPASSSGYVGKHRAAPAAAPAPASGGSGFSSSSLSDIPGVPPSFAACVALRESSNGTNQAYNGGVYGIITASGINVNGQSLAAQKQAFAQLYKQYGDSPWRPSDGCMG